MLSLCRLVSSSTSTWQHINGKTSRRLPCGITCHCPCKRCDTVLHVYGIRLLSSLQQSNQQSVLRVGVLRGLKGAEARLSKRFLCGWSCKGGKRWRMDGARWNSSTVITRQLHIRCKLRMQRKPVQRQTHQLSRHAGPLAASPADPRRHVASPGLRREEGRKDSSWFEKKGGTPAGSAGTPLLPLPSLLIHPPLSTTSRFIFISLPSLLRSVYPFSLSSSVFNSFCSSSSPFSFLYSPSLPFISFF